jgi:hypoxanthine phosphoribosyltransferase
MHSGGISNFKIECDAITEEDYKTLAKIISNKYKFKEVYGVPRGGVLFENALKEFKSNDNNNLLIVDDVLTTGNSMQEAKIKFQDKQYDSVFGVVVFSKGDLPDWIKAIFTLAKFFRENV